MAVEESHLEIGNTAFMVSFNFFFSFDLTILVVFSSVTMPTKSIITWFLWQIKLNILQTSDNDSSRTYTSLVKSTEDSNFEYVNQITAPKYVNAC